MDIIRGAFFIACFCAPLQSWNDILEPCVSVFHLYIHTKAFLFASLHSICKRHKIELLILTNLLMIVDPSLITCHLETSLVGNDPVARINHNCNPLRVCSKKEGRRIFWIMYDIMIIESIRHYAFCLSVIRYPWFIINCCLWHKTDANWYRKYSLMNKLKRFIGSNRLEDRTVGGRGLNSPPCLFPSLSITPFLPLSLSLWYSLPFSNIEPLFHKSSSQF